MKYLGWLTVIILLFCSFYFFQFTNTASEKNVSTTANVITTPSVITPASEKIVLTHSKKITNSITEDRSSATTPDIDRKLPNNKPLKKRSLPRVTEAQKTAVVTQEVALLTLAKEYETVRSDPDARQAHREIMQEKLALYNKEILPIALEKIKETSRQTN